MKSFQLWTVCFAAVFLCAIPCTAQSKPAHDRSQQSIQEMMNKYPGLLPEFANLFAKLQTNIQYPGPRNQSRLLPLLPESTVFYAAFPNYGDAAHQAVAIFQQELQTSAPLRQWSQQPDTAASLLKTEAMLEKFSTISQYLGDEVVIAASTNGKEAPEFVAIAEARKPGLKTALQQFVQSYSEGATTHVRVLDPAELARANDSVPGEPVIAVRSDFVIASPDLKTLRAFNARLESKSGGFASTPFGRRMQQAYEAGTTVVSGVNLQEVLRQAPMKPEQQQAFQNSGFADMKYVVWQKTGAAGRPASEGELSFSGPRHGIAGWLGEPTQIRGLEFVSPKPLMAASIVLKNLGEVFEDTRMLASAANPMAFASMDAMQAGMGVDLKRDLLAHLGGEITLEIEDSADPQPAWKAILSVNDPEPLQQTFARLLTTVPVQSRQFQEEGITYHTIQVPSANTPFEIAYAFTDEYLIIGSGQKAVSHAVDAHRSGQSLAKSQDFLAALPGGSANVSALLYQNPLSMMVARMRALMPDTADALSNFTPPKPAVISVYGDKNAIREASMSGGVDAGLVLVGAAMAIPNLLRARTVANESSAVGSVRNVITAQTAYAVTYGDKGYARDLASLGLNPLNASRVSPQHAGLLGAPLADSSCTVGKWCEKSGYKFTLSPVCNASPCKAFVVVAKPSSPSSGTRSFCATSDAVVRYRAGAAIPERVSTTECRSWTPIQ